MAVNRCAGLGGVGAIAGRRHVWLVAVMLVSSAVVAGAEGPEEQDFRRENVLGTSCHLIVRGVSKERAEACERAVLAEIVRLGKVLNTREPASEISRMAASKNPWMCSADLYAVLAACEDWRKRTGGAFNADVGELISLWREAEKAGKPPADDRLTEAVSRLKQPALALHPASGTAWPLRPLHLAVAGLAKGYVIDKALAAGKKAAADAAGLLLDIGGDIAVWTAPAAKASAPWVVDVADPKRNEDNAEPMATLRLSGGAVATSGSYARCFQIGTERHSHIIDPKTGRPADGVISATVLAATAVEADALATALCVLPPARGVALTEGLTGFECLIVDAAGRKHTSRGWADPKRTQQPAVAFAKPKPPAGGETPGGSSPAPRAAKENWPKGFCVNVKLLLGSSSAGRRYRRPYVAVWVVDGAGKPVKTVELWVERGTKHDKELKNWYRLGSSYRGKVRSAVSRSTRPAGTYTLVWDGKDDSGRPVPRGTYRLCIEIAREKGTHVTMHADLACQDSPVTAKMAANTESKGATATYGPRGS